MVDREAVFKYGRLIFFFQFYRKDDCFISWFVNAALGDLHLESDIQEVIDKGMELDEIKYDIDGIERIGIPDIGADEF